MLNASPKRTKRRLHGRVDVEHAARNIGCCATTPTLAVEAGEGAMMLRAHLMDLEHLAVIADAPNRLLHVVGLAGGGGNERVELAVLTVGRILRWNDRRGIEIVRGQIADEAP